METFSEGELAQVRSDLDGFSPCLQEYLGKLVIIVSKLRPVNTYEGLYHNVISDDDGYPFFATPQALRKLPRPPNEKIRKKECAEVE